MTLAALRDRAIKDVVGAIGTGSGWDGYRFVEQQLEALSGIELAGEARRRYRYWMGWASEELSGGQSGEARSSLVDARQVQLEALAALEDALDPARHLAPEVSQLRLFDWDGYSVIFLADHVAHGEVLLEIARSAPNDHGASVIVFSDQTGEPTRGEPGELLEGGARLLEQISATTVLPKSLERGFCQESRFHIFEHMGGRPLKGFYANRERVSADLFDALMETLIREVPSLLELPGSLALDPDTLAIRDGQLVVWRVRGSCVLKDDRLQAVHPYYCPRWPMNPAYSILAMRYETGAGYTLIYGPFTHRKSPRFELDARLTAEVARASEEHPIRLLARSGLPGGERARELHAALGVSYQDGMLRDAPMRSLVGTTSPVADASSILTRYTTEDVDKPRLEGLAPWRSVSSGERVWIARLDGTYQPGSAAAQICEAALRLEANALARCDGASGLLRVLEHGEDPDGKPVVVLERVDGMLLSDLLREQGKLSFRATREIILQLCDALGALHRAGCIHTNVKPGTILVAREDGSYRATLLFSGIARSLADQRAADGVILGTLGYMAPEQFMARDRLDARLDLWALASTMLECLTGQPALSAEFSQFVADIQRTPASIAALENLDTSHPSLRLVLERALDVSPSMRQASCQAFAGEIRALEEPGLGRPPAMFAPSPEDVRPPQPHRAQHAHRVHQEAKENEVIAQRYRLAGLIREDVLCAVHHAVDLVTREQIEVVLYNQETASTRPRFEDALRRSWRALVAKPRQCVQRLRDFGETSTGVLYAVFDRLENLPTLQNLMDGKPMRYELRGEIITGVISALDELSDLQHEALHPGSIHIVEREVGASSIVVPGLELSSAVFSQLEGQKRIYSAGVVQYVAPEVLKDSSPRTVASDIWNLGALVYLLQTNQPPFGYGAFTQVIMKMLTEPPEPFARFIVGGHDRQLEEAVFKCLSLDPTQRYASLAEAARALRGE